MSPDTILIALTTCPDDTVAATLARALVSEGLAACVNRIRDLRSTYIWDGHLQDETEVLLIIKTTQERLAALQRRLRELHPYELPELVAFPVSGGNPDYLQWVRQAVAHRDRTM